MVKNKRSNNADKNTKRILIVDDHPVVRKGIERLINQEKGLLVCAQADGVRQARQALKNDYIDLAIVDLTLEKSSGLELIKDIRALYPDLPVLVLSMHDEFLYAERVLRAGARGYIMKQQPPEELLVAIHKVLDGQIYVSDSVASKMMSKFVGSTVDAGQSAVNTLSDRELEVFRLIGRGQGTRQIAEALGLSVKTIETYRAHIKEKLNLANSNELLQYAIRWVNLPERQ